MTSAKVALKENKARLLAATTDVPGPATQSQTS